MVGGEPGRFPSAPQNSREALGRQPRRPLSDRYDPKVSPFRKWFFTRATYLIIAVSIGFGILAGVKASEAEYIDPLAPGPFWQGVAAVVIIFLALMGCRVFLLMLRVTLWVMNPHLRGISDDVRRMGREYRGEG